MVVELNAWRLLLAVALVMAIVLSVCWAAPERSTPRSDLHRLILTGLALYAVGAMAALSDRDTVAALVFAAGIFICALAVWLSRGTDSEDPPDGRGEPADEPPPPGPDGLLVFDWGEFERAFRAYEARERASTR